MNLDTLAKARQQCAHYDNWRDESTRCPNTTEQGLTYYDASGRKYCEEHGPFEKYAKHIEQANRIMQEAADAFWNDITA